MQDDLCELDPLDPLERWNRPDAGKVDRWVRGVVAVACATTICSVALGLRELWRLDLDRQLYAPWIRDSVAIGVAIVLAIVAIPAGRLSRIARLAVALPIVHVVTMVIVWRLWVALMAGTVRPGGGTPLPDRLPLVAILAGTAAVWLAAGWLVVARVPRRRRGHEWLQATSVLGLIHLLLLGLWLPIAARLYCPGDALAAWVRASEVLAHPARFACLALLPPLVGAIAAMALVMWRPARARRRVALIGVLLLVLGAVIARAGATNGVYLLYGNFTHVLLGTCFLTITSLLVLGGVIATRRHRAPAGEPQTGVIVADAESPVVACTEITSWLRGPRTVLRAFTVATARGELVVPAGAELVMAVPLVTTMLRTGEAAAVLRAGERVVLEGYVDPTGGHPFRGSAVPIPGSDGIFVRPVTDERHGLANVALALWRPCVSYLLIVIAIAIPALVAAIE